MASLFVCVSTVVTATHDARWIASMCANGVLATTSLPTVCAGSMSTLDTLDEILVGVLSLRSMGSFCVRRII